MKKGLGLKIILAVIAIFVVIFLAGPKPKKLELSAQLQKTERSPEEQESIVIQAELGVPNIKPGNESVIIWADSLRKHKTPYAIVYLHGFSACGYEGFPVANDIARKFGCNLYLPRLQAHGLIEKEPMLEFSEEGYIESAKQAVAAAFNLGEKVIIMGTSTGCTAGLYIASGNPEIAGLIMYSPNVDLFDSKSFLLSWPWGLQMSRAVLGGKYYSFEASTEAKRYWTTTYRIEAIVRLKNLLNSTMLTQNFEAIEQPTLMCYYYKNEQEQDLVVSVPAMLKMFDELGTPDSLKLKLSFPEAKTHAIASNLWNEDVKPIEDATSKFMMEVMHIPAVH